MEEDRPKILLVGDDAVERERLIAVLTESGLRPEPATTQDAVRRARDLRPSLVLLDVGDGADGFGLLDRLNLLPETADVPVVILTSEDSEADAARAFEHGADDLIRKPLRTTELLARIRSHLRLHSYVEELARKERDAQVMLELTQALASSLDFREILYTVVRRIADVVQVDRVSIVLAPEEADGGNKGVGYVVAASDDEQVSNLRLDLAKYPEIQQVLRTREPLTINDVQTHPVLDLVRADVQRAGLASLSLLPIVWEEQAMGVLFLRAAGSRHILSERDLSFCRIVANATAVALRNARVMQSLRDQTQQVTFARFEAERRMRSLKRYADLFASAADGLAAVDLDGRLLFANPRAVQIGGATEQLLLGQKLKTIVHADDRALLRELNAGFARNDYPSGVDVRIERVSDHESRTLSVSFSPLAGSDGVVLFSFRDVTEERRTAAELGKTKEFLESLIDASVDPIVASDLRGTIILFNRAAERVYGWRSVDMIGKQSVKILYPEGGAREIMRMIRSPQHGGVGRLDNIRCDAVDSAGERIPIMLSAAMIYERGVPVATFGIFTDLREKLRVEERLAHAQQQLAVSEKQALIAELAGTAAHELNQPLTSVMVYAELLKRKLLDRPEITSAEAILREAERMADIVRKIGKITKYETKSYVGTQKILDLDRATGGSADESGEARARSSEPPARTSDAPVAKPSDPPGVRR